MDCALALAKSFFPLWLVTSFLFTDLLLLLLQTKVKGLEKNFCVVAVIHMSKDAKQFGLWITGGLPFEWC